MGKYWLHRISWEQATSRPLLDEGYLTIGFSDLSCSKFLKNALNANQVSELDSKIRQTYGTLLRSRYSLWRFLRDMNLNDCVLIPGWGSFSVYVVKSEPKLINDIELSEIKTWDGVTVSRRKNLLYAGDFKIDLGFYREVEVYCFEGNEARDISRLEYADNALTKRLKARQTNLNISDLAQSIHNALEAFSKNTPINLYSEIMKITPEAILNSIYQFIDSNQFECLIRWYFIRIGATGVEIPPKNQRNKSGDADIVATFEQIKVIVYVQAKLHGPDTTTDNWATDQITEYVETQKELQRDDEYAKSSWVISTAKRFSKECENKAKANGVNLIDGIEFAKLLIRAGFETLETVFE